MSFEELEAAEREWKAASEKLMRVWFELSPKAVEFPRLRKLWEGEEKASISYEERDTVGGPWAQKTAAGRRLVFPTRQKFGSPISQYALRRSPALRLTRRPSRSSGLLHPSNFQERVPNNEQQRA